MRHRLLGYAAVVAMVAGALAGSPEVAAGQARATAARPPAPLPGADAARAFAARRMARGFTPPKTPWGAPDLQGNFTNVKDANVPLERPDEFAGRQILDITAEELAQLSAERNDRARLNLESMVGVPTHWFDSTDASNTRPWFVIDPADGKIPPPLPQAAQRAASRAAARPAGRGPEDSYIDRSLVDRCIVRGIPVTEMLPKIYGNSYQILQTRDSVVIRYEQIHETRIIPLDGRPLTGRRSDYGEARAHFDGNTLVVVTTNFADRQNYRGAGPQLRTIERFTRTAPDKVEWTVTIEDPETWARPWTYSVPLTQDDTQLIIEYACHEGNYALPNILNAGRSDERTGKKTGTTENLETVSGVER